MGLTITIDEAGNTVESETPPAPYGQPEAPSGEVTNCAVVTSGAATWSQITESGPQPWTAGVGCIPWQANQWAASYRNVPFCVDSDSRTGGRRIQVHEFPDREDWVNEDLGRLRQQIDVTGFVYGDRSDEWAEMLFAACTTKGPSAELYLPMRVPLLCACLSVESSFAAEQMGRLNFRMTFSIEPWTYATAGSKVPTIQKPVSAVQLQNAVSSAGNDVYNWSRSFFDEEFTGL